MTMQPSITQRLGDPSERLIYARIRYASRARRTAKQTQRIMSIISFLSLKAVRNWFGRIFKPSADLVTRQRPLESDEVMLVIRGRLQINEDEDDASLTWTFIDDTVTHQVTLGPDVVECEDELVGMVLLGAPVSMLSDALMSRIKRYEDATGVRIYETLLNAMHKAYVA
jgi:hypothetical protein